MHHILHVAETKDGVKQSTGFRGFEVDFLYATGECGSYQPADDAFSCAVSLMLGAHVDVHQIGTMPCGIVRRRHLIVEAQTATADNFAIILSEAGNMTAILQSLAVVVEVLLAEFCGVNIAGDGEHAMQHLHTPMYQQVKVIERCLTDGDAVMHTAVPPF